MLKGTAKNTAADRGRLIARMLRGAWRLTPPPLSLSAVELSEIAPLLLMTGAGGLGWWRVRDSDLAGLQAAIRLHQTYRRQSLRAALYERGIANVVRMLRSAGIEPILIKGWAAARHYAEPGLRWYDDVDLCVRPEQRATAWAVLMNATTLTVGVDLHDDFSVQHGGYTFLNDRMLNDLYDRSLLVPLGDGDVRILAPEDHLRLLCFHMLSHGACRPLWLCDIAAALEAQPSHFDWRWCLGNDRRRADWVACALGLAHMLLGARLEETPVAQRAGRLPHWLVPAVLRQWGRGYRTRMPMRYSMRRPLAALAELRHHWPNGVEATMDVRGSFNGWPRLPFQVGACVARTVQLLAGIRLS